MLYSLHHKALFVFCLIISSTTYSITQNCLPGGITLERQTQIDSFPINYPGCNTIIGDLIIQESTNNNILSLGSLSQLQFIQGSLRIRSNDAISSFTGLDNITTIGADLEISNNGNIQSISGLNNVTQVGGDIEIISNVILFNSGGLEGITSIPGSLRIINNGLNYPGLMPMLTSVGGTLSISSNDITTLSGLSNLQSVGGIFSIHNNDNLSLINGLDNLSSVGATLEITSNDLLMSITSLSTLTSVGGDLKIAFNPDLTDINTFSGLSSVGFDLEINGNDQLPNLIGLDNIASVGRDLYIFNNGSLSTLEHLSNITSIGGTLTVQSCAALFSLQGLENINPIPIGWVYISNNINLSDCAYQSICDYLDDPGNGSSISNNDTGCATRSEIESACNTVPIVLINLHGISYENHVEIMWSTSLELDNVAFDIERSVNRKNWDKIGIIEGAGFSNEVRHYSYKDNNPYPGTSFYRLKQTDHNGDFTISDEIKVDYYKNSTFSISPNPAYEEINISIEGNLVIRLLDQKGKVLIKRSVNDGQLEISDLPPGIYFCHVVSDQYQRVQKLIKL